MAIVLLIAFVRVDLVGRYFMKLRGAPWRPRIVFDAAAAAHSWPDSSRRETNSISFRQDGAVARKSMRCVLIQSRERRPSQTMARSSGAIWLGSPVGLSPN